MKTKDTRKSKRLQWSDKIIRLIDIKAAKAGTNFKCYVESLVEKHAIK